MHPRWSKHSTASSTMCTSTRMPRRSAPRGSSVIMAIRNQWWRLLILSLAAHGCGHHNQCPEDCGVYILKFLFVSALRGSYGAECEGRAPCTVRKPWYVRRSVELLWVHGLAEYSRWVGSNPRESECDFHLVSPLKAGNGTWKYWVHLLLTKIYGHVFFEKGEYTAMFLEVKLPITYVRTFHLVLLKTAESALRRSSSSSRSCFTCRINLHMVASLVALKIQLRLLASSTISVQTVPPSDNVLAFPTIQRQCLH